MREHLRKEVKDPSFEFSVLYKLFDLVIIFFSLRIIVHLHAAASWSQDYALLALSAIISYYMVSEIFGWHKSWRGVAIGLEIQSVMLAWCLSLGLILLYAYVFKTTSSFSRLSLGFWFVVTPVFLFAWRILLRGLLGTLRVRGYNIKKAAIACGSEQAIQIANIIHQSPWLGLELIGVFDDRQPTPERVGWDKDITGSFQELVKHAREGTLDVIYIAIPISAQSRILELTDMLADTTITVYLVPDLFFSSLHQGRWSNLERLPLISVYDTPFLGFNAFIKRIQDLLIATIALILFSIPMLIIACAIKLTSAGPIIFKQRRYGADGEQILVWKFRSMSVGEDGERVQQVTQNDQRVTQLGRFLRKTSLDELPQLFNVLSGSMSVVGPRPHAVAHNEEYRGQIKGYMLRHSVKPGITGWAQVNGWRGETKTLDKMEKRIEHDIWYIHNWSLLLDVKILALTVIRGFVHSAAY